MINTLKAKEIYNGWFVCATLKNEIIRDKTRKNEADKR